MSGRAAGQQQQPLLGAGSGPAVDIVLGTSPPPAASAFGRPSAAGFSAAGSPPTSGVVANGNGTHSASPNPARVVVGSSPMTGIRLSLDHAQSVGPAITIATSLEGELQEVRMVPKDAPLPEKQRSVRDGLEKRQSGITRRISAGVHGSVKPEHQQRIYEDERFVHGVYDDQTADDDAGEGAGSAPDKPGTERQTITKRLSVGLGRGSLGGNQAMPYKESEKPMPKWPAGHYSAAFEAVVQKKSSILSPAELYAECAHHGLEKSKFPLYKMAMLSFIAGFYVGFGFTTCLQVGGTMLQIPIPGNPDKNLGVFKLVFGAFGFPFGFTCIVVCGAELYTSMCAYSMAAMWEGKINIWTKLYCLAITWSFNYLGCLGMAGLVYASGIFHEPKDTYLLYLAHDKVSHPWGETFVKGIFANWLVGIATWMANAAQDMIGKFIAIWLPISAFAAIGLEHCIANQFLLSLALMIEPDIMTAKQYVWNNMIPATLGNWIGGAICVATTYAMTYGRTPILISEWWEAKKSKYRARKAGKSA